MNIEKLKQHQSDIPYIMVSREVIQCLGIDALAIWAYLQSLPDDWKIREQQVRSHFGLSRARWLKAMKELREAGLYSVERLKDDAGNFTGSHFHIYAFPQVRKTTLMENDTCITEEDIFTEEYSSTEKMGERTTKHFCKPTPKEVEQYAKEINFSISGDYFVDYYETKGWMVGKNKMKDWKAAIRTWKNRSAEKPKENKGQSMRSLN